MSRESVLARGRQAAEAGMRNACLIRRRTGESTDANGAVTPTYTQVYAGQCRLQQSPGIARPETPGESQVYLLRLDLQLPVATSAGVQVDDEVIVTTAINDADLTGRRFFCRALAHASEKTARRVGIEEVAG